MKNSHLGAWGCLGRSWCLGSTHCPLQILGHRDGGHGDDHNGKNECLKEEAMCKYSLHLPKHHYCPLGTPSVYTAALSTLCDHC